MPVTVFSHGTFATVEIDDITGKMTCTCSCSCASEDHGSKERLISSSDAEESSVNLCQPVFHDADLNVRQSAPFPCIYTDYDAKVYISNRSSRVSNIT